MKTKRSGHQRCKSPFDAPSKMKLFCLCILLSVKISDAFAQKDSSLALKPIICHWGLYYSPTYTVPVTPKIWDVAFKTTGTAEWGSEIGSRIVFRLNHFFSFATGLSYSVMNYHTHISGTDNYLVQSGSQYLPASSLFILNENCSYYSMNVPLYLIGSFSFGRFQYYAGIGEENSFFTRYIQRDITTDQNTTRNLTTEYLPRNLYDELYFRPGVFIGSSVKHKSRMSFYCEAGVKEYKFGNGYFANLYNAYINFGILFAPFMR